MTYIANNGAAKAAEDLAKSIARCLNDKNWKRYLGRAWVSLQEKKLRDRK